MINDKHTIYNLFKNDLLRILYTQTTNACGIYIHTYIHTYSATRGPPLVVRPGKVSQCSNSIITLSLYNSITLQLYNSITLNTFTCLQSPTSPWGSACSNRSSAPGPSQCLHASNYQNALPIWIHALLIVYIVYIVIIYVVNISGQIYSTHIIC